MSSTNGNGVCAQTFSPAEGPHNLTSLDGTFEDADQQHLIMRLDIYSESIFRTTYHKGQEVATDELHPRDVAAAMAGLDTGTGILPERALFYRQLGKTYHIGIYIPPGPRTMRVLDGDNAASYTIPLPALIFAGQGQTYSVYALADPGWPTAGTALYQAPMPNVNSGGRICTGNVEFPSCRPGTIHQAVATFFDSDFNNHLRNAKSQAHKNNIIVVWRELQRIGADAYPVDDLVPLAQTVNDLLKT